MNDLHRRLSMLADEMADSDFTELRGRVEHTSRRIRRRQAVLTSVAAVAAVGVLVAGGSALLGSRGDRTPETGGTSTAVTTPPDQGHPTVTPDPIPKTDPTRPVPQPPRTVPGTLTYLRVKAGRPVALITVTNPESRVGAGTRKTTVFGVTSQTEPFVGAVSPDGRRLAVIESPAGRQVGELVVMEPGGKRRTLARQVFWGGGVHPVWTPDSRGVLVQIRNVWTRVDAATGATTRVAGLDAGNGYITWSADGTWRAYAVDARRIAVSRPDGTDVRQASVAGLPDCEETAACPFAVQAVSDDGRYVALGRGTTDPSHTEEAHLVLDVRTGRPVGLPQVIGYVDKVYFRPGGGLLVRGGSGSGAGMLFLLDAAGSVAGTTPDPVVEDSVRLVAYRP